MSEYRPGEPMVSVENSATPSTVATVVVPLSGPKPEPGASDIVTTATPSSGTPAPSVAITVTGGPLGS